MLFLLKRTWPTALLSLLILFLLGMGLRRHLPDPPSLEFSPQTVIWGLLVFGLVVGSDGMIHLSLLTFFGERYRERYRELVEVFRGQRFAAILLGAAMAGLGEELIFRGLSSHPVYLGVSAVVFGLLHHFRRSLWPFTLWAIWQGVLFALALGFTQMLGVTMVAHFLHDFSGFLAFGYLRWRAAREGDGSLVTDRLGIVP